MFFRFAVFNPAPFARPRFFVVLLGLLGLGLAGSGISRAQAADSPQQLKNAIEQQKSELDQTRAAQAKTRQLLKKTQEQLAQSSQAQEDLEDQIEALEARQTELNQSDEALLHAINELKPQIADSLKLAYTLGDQASLSSLFAYGDALSTERNLRYIKILLAQSMDKMTALKQAERQQISNRQDLLDAQSKLTQAQKDLVQKTAQRRAQQAEQNELLNQLSSRADTQSQHLASLLEQKKTLDAQIARINTQTAKERAEREQQAKAEVDHTQTAQSNRASTAPSRSARAEPTPDDTAPIATPTARSGAIPIAGAIIRRYGASIAGGDMQSQGIMFAAPLNSPVRAVAAGKVVFAEAMSGWGNLVILRHPGGYLSLYAHNSRLLVTTGTRVAQGTELALSGQIDGQKTGLYFEVRRGNDTINPARWAAYRAVSR